MCEDESVLTSVDYERYFMYSRKRYYHLDPRTRYPAEGAMAATVICRGAAEGDAATTALVVAGPSEWRAVARDTGVTPHPGLLRLLAALVFGFSDGIIACAMILIPSPYPLPEGPGGRGR
ncbi:MAG: FAD:protein FMN transferase [Gammaproteobacteria bacterium]